MSLISSLSLAINRLKQNISGGDPLFGQVQLLLHCNGTDGSTTFTDSSSFNRTVTANGNAQIDTAQSKFDGASALFDGVGDFLRVDIPALNIRTTPFTFEGWFRNNSGAPFMVTGADNASELTVANGQDLYHGQIGGTLFLGDGVTNNINTAIFPGISGTAFTHWALTFDGTTYRTFYDGVAGPTSTLLLKNTAITALQICGRSQENQYHTGWMDEFRITIGTARYTAPFTPPTVRFPDS